MECCILPHTTPLIVTYPNYTNLFFALGDHVEVRQWLLSRMIGLFGVWGYKHYKMIVNFYDNANPWYCRPMTACPYISTQFVNESILMSMEGDIVQFLKSQINEGYYIDIRIDLFEVPCYDFYHQQHYCHEILLYGYEEGAQFFYAAGFINSKGFETFKISYCAFMKSFFQKVSEPFAQALMFRYDDQSDVVTDRSYRSFIFHYNMSDAYLYKELEYYLNETRYPNFPDVYMGIQVYSLYQRYCHHLATSNAGSPFIFRQALQVVYSHKIILKQVYLHLFRDQTVDMRIVHNLDELIQDTLVIRNQLLKYSIAQQLNKVESVIPKLTSIEKSERDTLHSIINKQSSRQHSETTDFFPRGR